MRKRALSLLAALLLCASLLPLAAQAAEWPAAEEIVTPAAQATDEPAAWAKADIENAISENLVPAALQSQYARAITRAEFALLTVTLYETVTGNPIETGRNPFADTNDLNAVKAAAIGVTTGTTATTFLPDGTLTREQAATMLARLADAVGRPLTKQAASFGDAAKISAWAVDAVGQMQASGIMGGTGNNLFSPEGSYTREQSILTILRLFHAVGGAAPAAVPPSAVSLDTTSLTLETDASRTLTATVLPTDAERRTVTWASSNGSVASVSQTGVVTALTKGTATITARTVNDITAACVVTVTDPVKFTVPKLDYEYGPFKVISYYSSGKYWDSTQVDSLVFTKCEESNIGKYRVSVSVQGMTDGTSVNVYVYFYDANNRMLGKVWLNERVSANTPFNVLEETYVDCDIINNAVRLEFFSYSGQAAAPGSIGVGPSTPVAPPDNTPGEPSVTPPETGQPAEDDYAVLPGAPDFEKFVTAGRMSFSTNTSPGQQNNADITVSGTYSLPDGDYTPHIQPYLDELNTRGYVSSAAPSGTLTYKKDTGSGTIYISITPTKTPGDNYLVILVATYYKD